MSITSVNYAEYLDQLTANIENSGQLLDKISTEHNQYFQLNVIVVNSVTTTSETKPLIISKIKSLMTNDNIGICLYTFGSKTRCIFKPVMLTDQTLRLIENVLLFSDDYIQTQKKDEVIKSIKHDLNCYDNVIIHFL